MRQISATADLDAPPERVWALLTDTAGHAAWNPFITSMVGTLAVGERMGIRVAPPGARPMAFRPTITHLEPLHQLSWLGRLGVPGLFDGAHSFTLTPLPGSRTRLVQSERFSGILTLFAGKMLAKTQAGFEAMHVALAHELAGQSLPHSVP